MTEDRYAYVPRGEDEARALFAPGLVIKIQQSLVWGDDAILIRIDECWNESVTYTYISSRSGVVSTNSRPWHSFSRTWCLATEEEQTSWILRTLERA